MRRQYQRVGGHRHVLEDDLGLGNAAQPHSRFALADDEPGRLVANSNKPADPFLLALRVEDACENKMQARNAATGDPMLAAVDDKAVAAPVGTGGHLARRTARAWLGDADGGFVAGEHQFGGEALLRFAAVFHDGAYSTHIRLDDDAARNAAACRLLLDHQYCIEVAGTAAAVIERNGHAKEACLLQQVDMIPWILLGSINLGGTLGDVSAGQLSCL